MRPELLILAATTGPTVIDVLGYDLPVLSVLTAVIGVMLAYALAPPAAREPAVSGSVAILLLFALLLVAAEMYFQHTPLIALCWAMGLGFSGRVVLEELAQIFRGLVTERLRAVVAAIFPSRKDPE